MFLHQRVFGFVCSVVALLWSISPVGGQVGPPRPEPWQTTGCQWYSVPVYCGVSTGTCSDGIDECEVRIEKKRERDYFGCGGPALPSTSCRINYDTDVLCSQLYVCKLVGGDCVINLTDPQGAPFTQNLTKTVYNDPSCE